MVRLIKIVEPFVSKIGFTPNPSLLPPIGLVANFSPSPPRAVSFSVYGEMGRWGDGVMNFSDLLSHPSDSLSLFLPISLSPSPPSFEFFGENETALGVRGDQILCSLIKNWYYWLFVIC